MVSLEGKVISSLPDGKYKVEIEYKGKSKVFTCYVSGKIRLNHIMITEGDRVKIELSSYDPTQGKIVYRYR
ncbi:MAG: translation initiation factor IF-1 [Candidatus Dojkabacteria bacterium]|nr:MAG: translation initiation factor IF-1 [Candidatus Dojkabacteria bacterium]